MASLILLRNPLAPHTREITPLAAGTPVIDWLQAEHAVGFGMPIRFYVNGEEKPLDDLDYEVAEDDVAVIALMPAEPVSLSALAIQLAIAVAITAASYVAQRIFAPKERGGPKSGGSVSVYDIANDQNAAKIGEPIPVIYGTVLTSPDYVAQPYTFYNWAQTAFNQAYNGIQYMDLLLCVGQGNIDVSAVYLGDTGSTTVDAGIVTWQVFKPGQHGSTLGVIASAMGGGFHENVISSPEVGNQEFGATGDTAGYFATCKPGQKGSKFQVDLVFPQGATDYKSSSGNLDGRTIQFDLSYVELDDNDAQVGSVTTVRLRASTISGATITGPNMETTTVATGSETNNAAISAPIRRSYMVTAPRSARWAVKITRVTAASSAQDNSARFIWSGLKLYADYPSAPAYGNVTLLACRIKATQGLGNDAAVRIRVKASRRLTKPDGTTESASTSGADAFADVYVDTVYGAARPRTELDVTTLMAQRTAWASYQFNHVFRDRITVWDALRTISTPFGAEPLPLGAMMSVAQDGVKAVRSMLFTDANILEGSMAVDYSFDEEGAPDGIEIEYLDPKDFRQSYALWPSTSLRPDRFALPGVTNATHAAQYARLSWQRTQSQRKRITFDTELEGLILQLGDRIGVSHNVPKWGDGGLVVSVSGTTLTVDHDLDWTGGTKQILLRKPDGSVTDPVTVTRGARDNQVVLPSLPTTINYDNDLEYTSFAFGSATTLVRDFVVISTKPNGENTVSVEAVNYAPDIFTGAMSFLS